MRVKRGKLSANKEGGRLYVLLDIEPTIEPTTDRTDELIEELKDRVHRLEYQLDQEREARTEERRRQDTVIAQLSRANEEQARTIRELEAPSEPPPDERESPETVEDEQKTVQPDPAVGLARESPRRRMGPRDTLPLREYVEGILVSSVTLGGGLLFSSNLLGALFEYDLWQWILMILVAITIAVGGTTGFGFWVGYNKMHLDTWRVLVPVGAVIGLLAAVVVLVGYPHVVTGPTSLGSPSGLTSPRRIYSLFAFAVGIFYFAFAAFYGHGMRRRRLAKHPELRTNEQAASEAESSTTSPARSVNHQEQWSPRKQSMFGLVGTIVASVVTATGAIVAAYIVSVSGN
jgi:hypothetical protein